MEWDFPFGKNILEYVSIKVLLIFNNPQPWTRILTPHKPSCCFILAVWVLHVPVCEMPEESNWSKLNMYTKTIGSLLKGGIDSYTFFLY